MAKGWMKKEESRRALWWLWPLLGLVAAATLWILIAMVEARRTQTSAQECFQTIMSLQLGQSGMGDVQLLRNRFNGTDITPGGRTCSSESCDLIFLFDNKPLSQIQLAPLTALGIGVQIERGIVIGRGITYLSSSSNAGGSYFVNDYLAAPGSQSIEVHALRDTEGHPIEIHVRLTTAASPEDRRRVYSFDLSCLSKIGGCSDRSKILPELPSTADVK